MPSRTPPTTPSKSSPAKTSAACPCHGRHGGRKRQALENNPLVVAGLRTEPCEPPGHPIVYGEWLHAAGQPTVLVYGHYDVQPPDPLEQWITGPFEPTVRNGNIHARGAVDDKGQVLTHLKSVESWLKTVG